MYTVDQSYVRTLEEKKSKFHAFLVPYDNYAETLAKLKEEHPKARHFVTAFRYYNELKQVIEGSSDDGEPRGSSGKPTLKVLQGNELINVAVITVRYFGGVLLGVGGLVRAYGDSANLAIKSAELIPYEEFFDYRVETDYENSSKYEYLFKKHGIDVVDRNFLDGITYIVRCSLSQYEALQEELKEREG